MPISDERAFRSLKRRVARWKKNPPSKPIALGPIEGDVVKLAYRAKDGTLGIALFQNTYGFFHGGTPEYVEQYIRDLTARAPDDLSEGLLRVSARGAGQSPPASAAPDTGRPTPSRGPTRRRAR